MKKRLYVFFIIVICFLIIGFFLYNLLTTVIYIEKFAIDELISFDIDNDGNKEQIKVSVKVLSDENITNSSLQPKISNLNSKKEITITINNKNYIFITEKGESVIDLAIADLNLDNNFELLVCVYDDIISPSYRRWNIYQYSNNDLTFVKNIYDGHITYNKLINKLKVTFNLHETIKPMTETVFYNMDFLK